MGKTPQEFVPLKYANDQEGANQNMALNLIFALGIGALMYQMMKGKGNSGGAAKGSSKGKSKKNGGFMGGGGLS